MGVEFIACNNCGETFPDCGDYVSCECGNCWCDNECAKLEGFRYEEDGFVPRGSKWSQETSCDFCRQEDYEDYELLAYALKKLGVSREELIADYNLNERG